MPHPAPPPGGGGSPRGPGIVDSAAGADEAAVGPWFKGLARPYLPFGLVAVGAAALGAVAALVPPYLAGVLVNRVLEGHDAKLLPLLIAAAVAASLVRGALSFIQQTRSERFGQGILQEIRNGLYERLVAHGFPYYDHVHTGQLMSRLTTDVEWVRTFFSNGFTQATTFVFTVVFVLAGIFVASPVLGALTLVLLPLLFLVILRFDRRVRPAYREIRRAMGRMTTTLQEAVAGIRVVKAFAQEHHEERRFEAVNREVFDRQVRAATLSATYIPLMDAIGWFLSGVMFLVGAALVIDHAMTLGSLVTVAGDFIVLVGPIRGLGGLVNMWEQGVAAGGRLVELWRQPPEIRSPEHPYAAARARGEVRFQHVGLAYDGVEALHDVTFHVAPGRRVAILGATGCGKSSLVHLIPRYYDVTAGSVELDGHDVRQWDLGALRSQVGVVLQESFLFSATLTENIAFGWPDAPAERVADVARAAQVDEFARRLPEGFDTVVGERGVGLSGGERQRVSIARALLVDPPVLVLDDATAAVDMETEWRIQEALSRRLGHRTTLLIAHRLSTLKEADEILVLEAGRIVQRGNHAELVRRDGLYRHLYEIQYRDRDLWERARAAGEGAT